ncbi:TetR family transcriptional regulator [Allostreptomyces psammosilenae]|uniref:AcrR family transcriptional regulator n=1 Tax=Allostreptomyces psammosilenae TaxID=1892865 RepID=A0A852ZYD1_9ACTN|nr:TetR family transcriptional regulator [Allostreptomyces psammosilenae]NYI07346.1 AcrR family transcriptional regulator [Allostreptomyces psammosilenae]
MPRNADATRARLLQAATDEFAEHGVAGARVDRIARAAGVNKNLIYVYFGSKEQLFDAVLEAHLTRVHDEVPFTAQDLPGYTARMFDFALAHPEVVRLSSWYALERRQHGPSPTEVAAYRVKLDAIAAGQRSGTPGARFTPSALLSFVFALAGAWTVANPLGVPVDASDPERLAEARRAAAEAVRLLSAATPAADGDAPLGPPPPTSTHQDA